MFDMATHLRFPCIGLLRGPLHGPTCGLLAMDAARFADAREVFFVLARTISGISPDVQMQNSQYLSILRVVALRQAVVTIIDPASLWINARFDQRRSLGLRASLPARIALRSQAGPGLPSHVLRIEPLADSITEETLAKIVFDQRPDPLPPLWG